MSKNVLSLKNLYRFLFDCDYPVFSMGIVEKKYHVGLTVTKFWQDKILPEFRNTKSGKVIWRAEGGRNKYTSEILNRSGARSIYVKYAEELVYITSQSLVFRQIEVFKDFLVNCNYNYKVFMTKMSSYLEILSKEDDMFDADVRAFFQNAMAQRKKVEDHGAVEQAFLCGWFLTFLMLYSFAGNEECYKYLRHLSHDKKLALDNLVATYFEKEYTRKENKYLTERNSELCSTPLERRHYFGREEALFDVHEMLRKGGKYLISGIGGAGKTELMRQFLADCENEDLVDYICVIQYEKSFADSLIHSFAQPNGSGRTERLQEAIATIRRHEDTRMVIVVDNVDKSMEEDSSLEILLKLCTNVFITSRHQRMEGFETYQLKHIERNAAGLIFRDNYGAVLKNDDKEILDELLNQDLWRHTLTLKLLGKVTKARGWTLLELLNRLKRERGISTGNLLNGHYERRQLYQHMYTLSNVSDHWNQFLRLFASLPYGGYDSGFLSKYMCGLLENKQAMESCLEQLWCLGWLELHVNEYSMHPFVAECILRDTLKFEEARPFFDAIIEEWLLYGDAPDDYLADIIYTADTMENTSLQKATLLAGGILQGCIEQLEGKYLQLMLLALGIERSIYGDSEQCKKTILRLMERADKISINAKCYICAFYCRLENDDKKVEAAMSKMGPVQMSKDVVQSILAIEYLSRTAWSERIEELEKLAVYYWKNATNYSVRIRAIRVLAQTLLDQGYWDKYEEYMLQALGEFRTLESEFAGQKVYLWSALATQYVVWGRYADADKLLTELQELAGDRMPFGMRIEKAKCAGLIKLYKGEGDFGVADLEEAVRLCEYADGWELSAGNVPQLLCGDLAIAYNKVGQREMAEVYYKRLLEYLYTQNNVLHIARIHNNMGVMYLDWEKLEDAKQCLRKAYKTGKEHDGMLKAESANNLSKLYHKQGNRKKELEYLEIALPILEKYYGSEHPKVIDAKKRKNEG